ncbi:MAG: phosphoribosylformylglycinamidine synthase subunit PurS [Myxococcota bacterium]|jgi:phosphoribosylformylglycinamidine synthase|nr:phosphoribosylformylglycinamidine synthase [Myxococcales bacterium]MEC7751519.1 phosphoribosylformylglycinamidine synthase subunit PurS [Myxococcota bacterium]|tara:strand:- start:444 stop:689 length:246 start_codon:yes stop_codon:yes gene_type:complete
MKATVTVSLKAAVLDPQGKAIAAALRDLGLDLVESARVGKVIELQLSEGADVESVRRQVETAADQLLANPVMEDWRVEIEA